MTEREQIKPWKAIEYAIEVLHYEDPAALILFLKDCREGDMVSIAEDWPEFVEWIRKEEANGNR